MREGFHEEIDPINRRDFLGISGATLGIFGPEGREGTLPSGIVYPPRTGLRESIEALVETTSFVDTHEHFLPEEERVAKRDSPDGHGLSDFGLLFSHYSNSDLQVAGMSDECNRKLVSTELSPRDKWRMVAPYYERCRNTGYMRCFRETVRALVGEDDIREDNCETISRRLRDGIEPGYYRRILRDAANVEYAQVSLNSDFGQNPAASDLVCYDIRIAGISGALNRDVLNSCAGAKVATLDEAHATIDRIFETYAAKAIAVKDLSAYTRRLDFDDVNDSDVAAVFRRFAEADPSLSAADSKALQDNMFRRCLKRATDYGLPVKLHTGYLAGHGNMDLASMRDNMRDIAHLVQDFPDTTFVLMHIGYPYQRELVALCKRCPRVYADMCWAWIIDPASSTQFLKAFLTTAPAAKLLTFGGDFNPIELVPGHARMARQGIALAIAELVEDHWISESDVAPLVDRLMRGNAHEVFDLQRVLRAHSK